MENYFWKLFNSAKRCSISKPYVYDSFFNAECNVAFLLFCFYDITSDEQAIVKESCKRKKKFQHD